jgi:hypothetical protein
MQYEVQEKVGFFTGIKLIWNALVNTILMFAQTGQTVSRGTLHAAEMFEESMQVAHSGVTEWVKEEQLKNENKLKKLEVPVALPATVVPQQ